MTHFPALVTEQGLSPAQLFAAAGLDDALLRHPDQRIPIEAVSDLLELTASAAASATFGLRLGSLRRPTELGAISLLITHLATLREALAAVLEYQHLVTHSVAIHIEDTGPLALIHADVVVPGHANQATEMFVGMIISCAREVLGPLWAPVEVCFTHGPPADVHAHRRLLRCPVRFNADFCGIVCRAEDLAQPNPQADASMARYARQFMESLPIASGGSLLQEVRKTIYMLLPSGRANGDLVARGLGMSLRSLQRRLGESGTHFQQVLDEVRRDLTLRYIENPDRPLGDIAALVGFRSQSAFSRWFGARFGKPAVQYRQEYLLGVIQH